MSDELGKYMGTLQKGDKISLVLAGVIVDGTFEEMVDNCIALTNVTSPTAKKKQYSLTVPLENIYAWGKREKKGRRQSKAK